MREDGRAHAPPSRPSNPEPIVALRNPRELSAPTDRYANAQYCLVRSRAATGQLGDERRLVDSENNAVTKLN
jgi:hypothetical protein